LAPLLVVPEARTPVIALRVFGVIVAPVAEELIMLRNAAVLGDGGGNETGPPIRGVRPVPGVSPVRGVRPVRKLDGSNASGASPLCCCGPASIAGERGPALRELAMEVVEKPHWYWSDGDAIDSIGGRIGFWGEGGLPSRVRAEEDEGVLGGPLEVTLLVSDLA
jgi:hypothetical protein